MKKISRRNFLQGAAATVATVAAVSALGACGNGGSSSSASGSSSAATQAAGGETQAAGGDAAAAAEVTLKYSLVDADNSNYAQGAYKIAELVNQYTNGKVAIEVFAGGTLGDEAASTEGCANGEIDIATCANSVLENYFPECAVLEKPFLWENADAANYAMGAKIGELMKSGCEAAGLHMIGWKESGFRNLFSKKAVKSLADMQGMKVRTMGSALQVAMWTSFGTVATPMAASEQYTALQQGTIDACENAVSNDWINGWYEICPYVTWTNHYFCYIIVVMSDYAYNKVAELGDDVMEGFMKGVSEGCTEQWQYLVDFNNEAVDNLKGAGIEFFDMPAEDIQTMRDNYAAYIADPAQGISFDETWEAALNEDIAAFAAM